MKIQIEVKKSKAHSLKCKITVLVAVLLDDKFSFRHSQINVTSFFCSLPPSPSKKIFFFDNWGVISYLENLYEQYDCIQ